MGWGTSGRKWKELITTAGKVLEGKGEKGATMRSMDFQSERGGQVQGDFGLPPNPRTSPLT